MILHHCGRPSLLFLSVNIVPENTACFLPISLGFWTILQNVPPDMGQRRYSRLTNCSALS